ncbi:MULTISPECIES: DUF6214 family protein [Streptomyces]|uniref:DUF6214 family protein n=1 Tax=Streptomyces caniscabiei TaxID=2746961 RepID=A0ABU4MUT9_9ACTN|nr:MULTISPECIES: DUF6214 family protein [Streptomyces]MBE4741897.1 hypothetical protein [Streptomyces caniscabiei]MBE4762629.1 hypothetical protein [Streptomyces caniscabiei]MBE4775921.1 hypothetical protein [Streptomyces caniscabiei]MBE4790723.1 hypothetical protein [Streptomyces caniscabiei]MBE4799887.1 hypothetical protein [Streptomyces caniscabiei]
MSVRPAWEVQEHDGATAWYNARLSFPDGAGVEVLAVVCGGRLSLEDVRAQPPLSLDDLAELADWIEGPLFAACGTGPDLVEEEPPETSSGPGRRARPAWPRGVEGRRLVAEEYLAAQRCGYDPVLAVMCATGHSRRKALRLIAGARDEGLLGPRHARR